MITDQTPFLKSPLKKASPEKLVQQQQGASGEDGNGR